MSPSARIWESMSPLQLDELLDGGQAIEDTARDTEQLIGALERES